MTETRIALSPHGLKDSEHHLLKAICALSEGRDRSYSFFFSHEPLPQPTIWIVDTAAESQWRERHAQSGALAVFIAPNDETQAGRLVVRRPMTPSRLLAALDAIAEQEMGYLSHVLIGGPGNTHPVSSAAKTSVTGHARHTALVVDDSLTIQKQIEVSLRALNISAVCVSSAEEALRSLHDGNFDIIFLDIVLPGDADGYQVCKSIRRNTAHKRTPVVMLTSKSSTFDRVRGSIAGCDSYLTKPVDLTTFKEVVEKYLPHTDDIARAQFT